MKPGLFISPLHLVHDFGDEIALPELAFPIQASIEDDCNALKEHLCDGFQYAWQLVHLACRDMQQAVSTDQGIYVSFVKTLYVHTTRLDAKGDAILENSRCSRCTVSARRNDRWPACLMPYGIFQRRTTDVNWSYDTKGML